MAPTNMSVQPAATDSAGKIIRPPMKQEDHPEHRMPPSEYNGEVKAPDTPPVRSNSGTPEGEGY